MAVSASGAEWVLLNAAPDLRQQINDTPQLHPAPDGPPRNSPIKAVVLTNGDVDAVAGLLTLREAQPFTVYGTKRVLGVLAENSIFDVLDAGLVKRIAMEFGRPFAVEGPSGPIGITIEAFPVPGKVPLYLEDETAKGNFGSQEGDTAGLKVTDTAAGRHFFYIPGCARLDDALRARLKGAPLLFFDGTLYANDEMIAQGPPQQDRRAHRPYEHVGERGQRRRACSARHRPQDLHPHQQLKSRFARRLARTRRGRRRRAGRLPTMGWR